MKRKDCSCGHPVGWHEGRSKGVEIVLELDPGVPGKVAPTFMLRCPDCAKEYPAKAFRRDLVSRRRCRSCSDALRARRRRPNAGVSRPHGLPSIASFEAKPHGTRVRYVSGCRCDECREANNAYERARAKLGRMGHGNPLVDATRVRKHLLKLARAGVGRRTVADVAGVPASSLHELRIGRKTKLRRETEAKILSVGADVLTDAKLVDAARTWKQLEWMLEQGYTRSELARKLGSTARVPALQIRRDKVTARTRAHVERVYREMRG